MAKNFLQDIPSPNGLGRQLTYASGAVDQNEDQVLGKVDFQRNEQQLSGHYFFNRFNQLAFTSATDLLQLGRGQLVQAQNISVNHVYTASSTLLFNTWYGLNNESGKTIAAAPFSFPKLGVNIAAPNPPSITIAMNGGFNIASGNFVNFTRRVQTIRENVTWVKVGMSFIWVDPIREFTLPKRASSRWGQNSIFSTLFLGTTSLISCWAVGAFSMTSAKTDSVHSFRTTGGHARA